MNDEAKLKIIVLGYPGTGHINPLSGILRGIVDTNRARVICYGLDSIKDAVEKSGAEYRSYTSINWVKPPNPKFGQLFNVMLDLAELNLSKLTTAIEEEKPDLIIYDEMAIYAKFVLMNLEKKHRNNKVFTIPPAVMFRSGFGSQENVYPNNIEENLLEKTMSYYSSLVKPAIRMFIFSLRHGFGVYNLIKFMWFRDEKLNIVCVFPELHPRAHLFTKVNKFVGICLKEEMRSFKTIDEKLQSFIDSFEPINPLKTGIASRESHLIYASLGTVFNKQENAFVAIIEGL